MTRPPPDSRELGYYFALAQIGLEMVVPMVLGAALDYWLGWTPWGVVAGCVLGFVGGLAHLVLLVQRHDSEKRRQPPGEAR